MSDLQCAATLLVVPPERVEALLPHLAGRRVARVWSEAAPVAREAAHRAAQHLGVGEAEQAAAADALEAVADEHRGETVLVIAAVDAPVEVVLDNDGRVTRPLTSGG